MMIKLSVNYVKWTNLYAFLLCRNFSFIVFTIGKVGLFREIILIKTFSLELFIRPRKSYSVIILESIHNFV